MTRPGERPLVAVTRDERADEALSRALESKGARVLPLATIRIVPPADPAPFAAALEALAEYDWIVFTSANAVEATCTHPGWRGDRVRARIAAVGAATAKRLSGHGVRVDVTPMVAGGRELAEALTAARPLEGARVLWPRSDIARPELAVELALAGAAIVDAPAYRTVTVVPDRLGEFLEVLENRRLAAVAFLSPSSARGLASALPGGTLRPLAGRTVIASIGPTTSAAVAELGVEVDIEPEQRSAAALASAIVRRIAA